MEYISSMKVETSIILSEDLLKIIDKRSSKYKNRSEFIDAALRSFIAQTIRNEQNAKNLEIINRCAGRLNQEAEDVLSYQLSL